jgi:formylglycine-generating enzyme required for sulfatase activity
MSGNVREWEDRCDSADGGDASPANDFCLARGGSFHDGVISTRCDTVQQYQRNNAAPQLGFRCCSRP